LDVLAGLKMTNAGAGEYCTEVRVEDLVFRSRAG
jgi:hypothetical protein